MATMDPTLATRSGLLPGAAAAPMALSGVPLTAGEADPARTYAPPKHGWPASLYIFLCNAGAVFSGFAALAAALGWFDTAPYGGRLRVTAGLAVSAVVGLAVARGVRRFSRWGWCAAMLSLVMGIVTGIPLELDAREWFGSSFVLVPELLWLRYFWRRRADFGIAPDA